METVVGVVELKLNQEMPDQVLGSAWSKFQ